MEKVSDIENTIQVPGELKTRISNLISNTELLENLFEILKEMETNLKSLYIETKVTYVNPIHSLEEPYSYETYHIRYSSLIKKIDQWFGFIMKNCETCLWFQTGWWYDNIKPKCHLRRKPKHCRNWKKK